jgi:hypothetical protein
LINFGAAQVHAATFPVTFRLYALANGVMTLKREHSVTDSGPFWLPSGYRSDQYEVELEGAARVNAVYLAESLNELKRVA